MNSTVSHPAPVERAPNRSEQLEIDATAKWPVYAFLASAVFWLFVGGALQLVASIQSHTPAFLGSCEWFTFGRIHPAGQNALVYGWGFNAAFGVGLWLMARLSSAALRHGGWLIVAGKFWNIGVLLGIVGILGGWSTSYELLEMPRFVTLLLLASYALIAVWVVTTFSVRNTDNVYASQWYLFAAVFFFPWFYSIAQVMLFCAPAGGTVQAIVNAWYVNGVYGLWFVPLALAVVYYFLPKLLGRPVNLYYAAPFGFWWLLVTVSLLGGVRLIGAPVPVWVSTLGIASAFLLVLPLITGAMNLLGTVGRDFSRAMNSPTLSFVTVSAVSFLLWLVLTVALSLRGVAAVFHLTLAASGIDWLALYGCFSMAAFGAAYFIMPRLALREWRSGALIRTHFWAGTLGLALYLVASLAGAYEQGVRLNNPEVPFLDITRAVVPWLTARSVALMLLAIGHVSFLVNFAWMICPFNSGNLVKAEIPAPPALPLSAGTATEGHV